jgi:NADPH-dependent 2,4-dienoyl-CoA reductase/sulfur reductase-like enzyme
VPSVVVVGGGLAGLQTLVALRERGHAGPLTLVGAEDRPPYDRPPLSKTVLRGAADDSALPTDWAALDVDLRLGHRATGLRPGRLETDSGPVPFDRLVLATGSEPVRLPGDGALVLRTHDDALALRDRLRTGDRLAVVGAGWIGAEVATAAVAAGVRVTVVEAGEAPLAGVLPAEVGRRMLPWWREVDLRLGRRVDRVAADEVHLADGEMLRADTVLVGVGVRPASGWLHDSGVRQVPGGAVSVDSGLATSLPGVYAVGDLAAWESRRYGTRLRVEHWDHALHSPSVAAANLLAGPDAVETYDPVPYFWSEQWGRMVQFAGYSHGADRTVVRDGGDGTWTVLWLAGQELRAALAVDRPRDLVQARTLMRAGRSVDAGALTDPGVAVKATAR